MSLWRIRIAMSDDWRSQELLAEALAGRRVCSSLTSPRGTETTVEMIIESADVNALSALLGELHAISRQVSVSSAEQPSVRPPARIAKVWPASSATGLPLELAEGSGVDVGYRPPGVRPGG
jgi:hypothetical protein